LARAAQKDKKPKLLDPKFALLFSSSKRVFRENEKFGSFFRKKSLESV
jgi:hypothetical protein